MAELAADEIDLSGLGWDDDQIAELLSIEDDEIIAESEPAIQPSQGEPDSTIGSVYHLGPHVLVCGDCTDPESWSALSIDGASSVFTSPPYNLTPSSSALTGNRARADRGCAYLDNESPWLPLMNGWMTNAINSCEVIVCNVQLLAGNKREIFGWVDKWSDHLADVAIWDKQTSQPAMASNVMNSEWEFMFIFGEKGATRAIKTADFRGTESNIYRAPPQRRNEFSQLHGATFPIHLPAWALQSVLQLADVVVDPFGGTGTTLIAAAQARKSARLIEISPHYCDIIRRRWTIYARANNINPGSGALDPLDGE
jgi:DNA modification methylase